MVKLKNVKAVVTIYMELAVSELEKKPATGARKGVNTFTKEPCVLFKAKPASKIVKCFPMKKFKALPAMKKAIKAKATKAMKK